MFSQKHNSKFQNQIKQPFQIQKRNFSQQLPQFDPKIDYYKILGVSANSDEQDIKKAYYKLAQKYHPDKNEGKTEEKFKEISNAYGVLSDPEIRKNYDAMRSNISGQSDKQAGNSSFYGNNQWNGQQQQDQRYSQYSYYYKDKNGNEYVKYSYKGNEKDFFDDFFNQKNQRYESMKQQQKDNQKYSKYYTDQQESQQKRNQDAWQQYMRQQQEEQQKYYEEQKRMYDQMNGKNNPFTSDYDNPQYVARRVLRLFVISFSFIIFWKILFSKRAQREREIYEYMQRQREMEVFSRMQAQPEMYPGQTLNFRNTSNPYSFQQFDYKQPGYQYPPQNRPPY